MAFLMFESLRGGNMRQGDESGGAANEGPSLTDLAPPLLAIDNDEISVRY